MTHLNHPTNKDLGAHTISLTNNIYIEKEDWSIDCKKDFYRFMPSNKVRLRYDNSGDFYEYVSCNLETNPKKIKGCIHWISDCDAIEANLLFIQILLIKQVVNLIQNQKKNQLVMCKNTVWMLLMNG